MVSMKIPREQMSPNELALHDAVVACRKCGEFTERVLQSGKNKGETKREYTVKLQSKTATRLTESSTAGVPGSGRLDAPYLFIAEAPGEDEDKSGEGFTGRSGRYIKDKLIPRVAGINLYDCRFVNTIRCHPENNRNPFPAEIQACNGFLMAEIAIVNPKVIFTIGAIATKALLGISLKEGHGKIYDWSGIPVMPLYHPAAAGRGATSHKQIEQDYNQILRRLAEYVDEDGRVKQPEEYMIRLVDDFDSFSSMLAELSLVDVIAFDIESDEPDWLRERKTRKRVDPIENTTVGFSVAYRLDGSIRSWYVPTSDYADFTCSPSRFNIQSTDMDDLRKVLLTFLEPHFRRCRVVYVHNAKYEINSLEKYNFVIPNIFDTMIAAYALREESIGLKPLTKAIFNVSMQELTDIINLNKHVVSEANLAEVFPYGCNDTIYTLLYGEHVEQLFNNDENSQSARRWFFEIGMPLLPWVAEAESEGIEIDFDKIEELKPRIKDMLISLEEETWELYETRMGLKVGAGEFNLRSGDQVAKVLFEDLEIPPTKLTKSKTRYSVAKDDLEPLRRYSSIVGKVIEHASLSTIDSTFISGINKHIHPTTNRIHPNFNQTVTTTSRGSSNDPNIQNQPARDAEWKAIREMVVGDSVGYEIVAIDQSQIELRWAGHMSQDLRMMQIFIEGKISIHQNICREIYGITESHKDWDYHYKGSKNGNFATLYGAQWHKLMETLECDKETAQSFLRDHRRLYPGFWDWVDEIIIFAKNYGYAETPFGFRRLLPGITSRNYAMRSEAERHAVNTPVQGASAGHIQMAMARIYHGLSERNIDARMLLQVHDECVFSCATDHVQYLVPYASRIMETVYPLSVPTPVEAEVGPNWGQLISYKDWMKTNEL